MLQSEKLSPGGRDLSILLFSTRKLNSVTLNPLSPSTWIAACRTCKHRPLTLPLKVSGRQEFYAGGSLQVVDDLSQDKKSASGLWHLRSSSQGVDVVLTLPSERYVSFVLNAEAGADDRTQALQALAIVARTYALEGRHLAPAAGHLAADLCDSTQCQAMRLAPARAAIESAVRSTAGETLWYQGHQAHAFFSGSCGGTSEAAETLWPALRGVSYLASHPDPYCLRRGAASWHGEVAIAELAEIARAQGWRLPSSITSVKVIARSISHRARLLRFANASGGSAIVDANALRLAVGRVLGWNQIRSNQYEVSVAGGSLIFDGRGYGHGVGLCQAGATAMAVENKSARQILSFYFPGTEVAIQPGDRGWQTLTAGELSLRSTQAIDRSRQRLLEETWAEAARRFPSAQKISLEVTFAPSTELFRQLTSQPGWLLAGTSGSTIVLQPIALVNQGRSGLRSTLLHEFLHARIDAEAGPQTPPWLREGLVEELSGESRSADSELSRKTTTAQINAALLHPESRVAAMQAHQAAGARVHRLTQQYGLYAVRGWLTSSPPPGLD